MSRRSRHPALSASYFPVFLLRGAYDTQPCACGFPADANIQEVIASTPEGANWAAGGRRRTPARIVNCGLTNFEHAGVSSPTHTYVCQPLRVLKNTNAPDMVVLVAEKRDSDSEWATSCEHSRIVTEAHIHIRTCGQRVPTALAASYRVLDMRAPRERTGDPQLPTISGSDAPWRTADPTQRALARQRVPFLPHTSGTTQDPGLRTPARLRIRAMG